MSLAPERQRPHAAHTPHVQLAIMGIRIPALPARGPGRLVRVWRYIPHPSAYGPSDSKQKDLYTAMRNLQRTVYRPSVHRIWTLLVCRYTLPGGRSGVLGRQLYGIYNV